MRSNLVPWYYFTEYLGQGPGGWEAGAEGGLITSDFSCDDEPLTLAGCFSGVLEVKPLITVGCIWLH